MKTTYLGNKHKILVNYLPLSYIFICYEYLLKIDLYNNV